MIGKVAEELVFRVSMRAHRPDNSSELSQRKATLDETDYDVWRKSELEGQYVANFDTALLAGKRVVDFGCGAGDLAFFAARSGAANVTGVDLRAAVIARAERRREELGLEGIRFDAASDPKRIDLPDGSADTILCFDVLEHIMCYREVFAEWRRVLAPGGRILIWWSVYWHPYGHHLQTMIPIPWVHAFVSEPVLYRVMARIYDHPRYRKRYWHFDDEGQPKPNPYRGQSRNGYLNQLTIAGFERELTRVGLAVAAKKVHPFSGSRLAGLKRMLARLPWPDPFCACVTYEIVHGR